jgi:adenylate cyclase
VPGPDIFLSYNREDAGRARQFADAFAADGFDVWWDAALRSGEAYDKVTEDALRSARAVVVLWSPRSVDSRWVRAEATLAERRKTLMPAMIEPCERPIMFELVQTADLSHWQGDKADGAWKAFAADVAGFVGAKGAAAPPARSGRDLALPRLDQLSVVVLPFANMSGDPEQEYFADGISEDIITDLSKVSALMVIARNTAFTFKGKHVDVRDVARQLNVTHALEGSVRKSGNRVRVTAQLIDGATGGHVWAERFDRALADIFDLQDELSHAIVGALKLKLLPEEKKAISDRGTDNVEAYDFYLRAWNAFREGMSGNDITLGYLRTATALDSNFARAWQLMAIMARNMSAAEPSRAAELIAMCDNALEHAHRIDPHSATAYSARAAQLYTIHQDWLGAEEAYAKAAKFARGVRNFEDLLRAIFLIVVGRANDALADFETYARLDPLFLPPMYIGTLDNLRRFDEATARQNRMRELGISNEISEAIALIRSLTQDDAETVRRNLAEISSISRNMWPWVRKVSDFDRPQAVLKALHAAFDDPAFQSSGGMMRIAPFAAYFGDDELVLRCQRRAYVEFAPQVPMHIWHPLYARARQTEEFKQLIRDLGIYDYWRKSGNWGDFARPLGDDDFEMIG